MQKHTHSVATGDFNSAPSEDFYQQVTSPLKLDKRRTFMMRGLIDHMGIDDLCEHHDSLAGQEKNFDLVAG